ncbi:MAG: hypothetical protein GYA14_11185 [Ignavibacteria bacterium]|nr:hypothetical protein [Ignavibacteria bacterium]
MNDLQKKTIRMKELMDTVEKSIENLTTDNFNTNFKFSLDTMSEIQSIKKDLAQKYGINNIAKYDPEMLIKAKLIEKSYDNIIEKFRRELKKTENQLFNINKQKKITNYIR